MKTYNNTILTLKECKNRFEDYSTYTGVFNNDRYFLKDNTINTSYVAYNTTLTSFERYTPFMFDEYLKNYNISIVRDNNFKTKDLDKSFKIKMDKDKKLLLKELWVNHFDTILSLLKYETQNPSVKSTLSGEEFNWEEEYIELARENLKTLEKYYVFYITLSSLVKDPNNYIVDKESLASIQKLNNQIFLLKTMEIITNPKTENDKKNKEQILRVINGLIGKGKFTRMDIDKALDDINIINHPSYEKMELILKGFCKITYNKKTKTYTVK